MSIILGIDPGSRITGFGVIHYNHQYQELKYLACGCIRTLEKENLSERLGLIFKGLQDIIQTYKPTVAAIEQVFLKHNVLSALKLGHARGAAMAACDMFNLSVAEYSPRAVKQAVVGYGGAEKLQVQTMIMDLLKLDHKPSADASDALAVAICHGFHYRIQLKTSLI
jgi:crossover junction endodeoxyribonuclease RuvC